MWIMWIYANYCNKRRDRKNDTALGAVWRAALDLGIAINTKNFLLNCINEHLRFAVHSKRKWDGLMETALRDNIPFAIGLNRQMNSKERAKKHCSNNNLYQFIAVTKDICIKTSFFYLWTLCSVVDGIWWWMKTNEWIRFRFVDKWEFSLLCTFSINFSFLYLKNRIKWIYSCEEKET